MTDYQKKLTELVALVHKIAIIINPKFIELSHAKTGELDLGDLGSELGAMLPIMAKEEAEMFINGLAHGISLNNGTHGN